MLGPDDLDPELATLYNEKSIMLVEPEILRASAIAASVESGGRRYWYGSLRCRAGIHTIGPEAKAGR